MEKNLNLVFACLLLVLQLSSCSNSSTPYTIAISEGKTETEKTLIVKYNNMVVNLYKCKEKLENGEELTTEKKLDCFELSSDFDSFLRDNALSVRRELLDKIQANIVGMQDTFLVESNNNDNSPSQPKSKPKTEKFVEYIEKEVDLDDYLGMPNDGTDWNYTEIDEEEQKAFDEELKKNGIYYSEAKGCYVVKVKRTTTKNVPIVQFK